LKTNHEKTKSVEELDFFLAKYVIIPEDILVKYEVYKETREEIETLKNTQPQAQIEATEDGWVIDYSLFQDLCSLLSCLMKCIIPQLNDTL